VCYPLLLKAAAKETLVLQEKKSSPFSTFHAQVCNGLDRTFHPNEKLQIPKSTKTLQSGGKKIMRSSS
jgi:hypothetical protein